MDDFFYDPDDDVDTVFDALNAQRKAEADKAHQELLSAFFRDAVRIDHLDHSDQLAKAGLDVSTLAKEAVATFPKEWADDNPRH